jgi:hypothetical protein
MADLTTKEAITKAIGDNELAAEAYPYYTKNPLSHAGFDASRISIQPDNLNIRGSYTPSNATLENIPPILSEIFKRRGVDPSDQTMIFSKGGTVPRELLLAIIGHESGHSGIRKARGSPGFIRNEEAIIRLNDLSNKPAVKHANRYFDERWGKNVSGERIPTADAIASARRTTERSRQRLEPLAKKYLEQRYPGHREPKKEAEGGLSGLLADLFGD